MTCTPFRFTLFALATVALTSFFASSPAWAPAPVCPNCIVHSDKFTVGITNAEFVRICLVGLVTSPPSAAIDWEIAVFDADGDTVLTKGVEVPQQGFRCGDTTAEELRFAGIEPEPSGRIQFGLNITSNWDAVPLDPSERPEKTTMGGTGWHSVETINMLSGETTNSHRLSRAVDLVSSNLRRPRNLARSRSTHGPKKLRGSPMTRTFLRHTDIRSCRARLPLHLREQSDCRANP